MKLMGNHRTVQTMWFQGAIALFFVYCSLRIVLDGSHIADVLLLLICGFAIICSALSIWGMVRYRKQYYVILEPSEIHQNGLRRHKVELSRIHGYTLDSQDNLRLRSASGVVLLDIRCCYLDEADRDALLKVANERGGPMYIAPKTSIFSQLFQRNKG